MDKPESFEVTEYGTDGTRLDYKISAIKEIVDGYEKRSPNLGIQVAFTGNLMKLTFHAYEMHLPTRIKEVQTLADDTLKEVVKKVKSDFRPKTGETLTLKEMKDMADYSVQKVSLNERYYYVSWRFYEIG